jgi:hypothetical protein
MKNSWTLFLLLLACVDGLAQVSVSTADSGPATAVPGPIVNTGMFAYKEIMRGGESVKGAPYTATATTDTIQALADGNRIVNKSAAFVARDSDGRTRREETMSNAGPLPLSPMKMVFIDDPITGSAYVLNMTEKTVDVMKAVATRVMTGAVGIRSPDGTPVIALPGPETGSRVATGKMVQAQQLDEINAGQVTVAGAGPALGSRIAIDKMAQTQLFGQINQQALGSEVVEGLNCDHQLATQTIPAGALGNEQPIVITSETWISPELHLLIMKKHNDPRFGETVYKLTNIARGDPDPSLFQIPSDFRIMDKLPPLRSPLQ